MKLNSSLGWTLMEVLMTLGILSIMSSIAVVSYQSRISSEHLRQTHNTAKHFITTMKSCITAIGVWEVNRSGADVGATDDDDHDPCSYNKTGETDVCMKPCKDLERIGFKCPKGSSDTTQPDYVACTQVNNVTSTVNTQTGHVCFDLRRKIKGKNYQIVAILNVNNLIEYKIYCKEVTAWTDLTTTNCVKDSTVFKAWNSGNLGEICEWPKESKTSGGSTTGTTGTTDGSTTGTTDGSTT